MKIIMTETAAGSPAGTQKAWRFLPDSAFCNAGKPFFIPEFAGSFVAILAPAVKISRIGKSIAGKFATRYFSEIAPAIHFRSPQLMKYLRDAGLPDDMGCSFDRSLIVGDFLPIESIPDDAVISLLHNGETVSTISLRDCEKEAIESIEASSACNTLKMGDLIIVIPEAYTKIEIADRLNVEVDGRRILQVMVK